MNPAIKAIPIRSRVLAALALVAAGLLSPAVQAGNFTGNGGDHVRGTFFEVGKKVLTFLADTEAGRELSAQHQLDLSKLGSVLNIDTVKVEDKLLVDNGESIVDAIGEKNRITLNQNAWIDHFENERDVYYLVFHEMLRALEINDDDYRLSKALKPFPNALKLTTRLKTSYELIGGDLLAAVPGLASIGFGGEACPQGGGTNFIDYDPARNTLDLKFRLYDLKAGKGQAQLARKTCGLAIPLKARPGKRLVVSQVDLIANADLAPGATAVVNAEVFFSGQANTKLERVVAGGAAGLKGRVLLRKPLNYRGACDADAADSILRLATAARLTDRSAKVSKLMVDRATLYFDWEDCKTQAR